MTNFTTLDERISLLISVKLKGPDMMRDTKELKNTKNNLKEKEFTARVGVLK